MVMVNMTQLLPRKQFRQLPYKRRSRKDLSLLRVENGEDKYRMLWRDGGVWSLK